ncbi:hypothetical protein vseg_012765 [Gypsophila vaccaria]
MIIPQNDVVPPQFLTLTTLLIIILLTTPISSTQSRDLRPSDHGLPFQPLPPQSPQTPLFFGASPPKNRRPSSPPPQQTAAEEDGDEGWGDEPLKKRKVRKGLAVATAVCGGAGVVLLCTAAVLFGVHFYRRRRPLSTNSVTNTVVSASQK